MRHLPFFALPLLLLLYLALPWQAQANGPVSMPGIVVSNVTREGQTQVKIALTLPPNTSCGLTTSLAAAQADPSLCFVGLTSTMPGLVLSTNTNWLPMLKGYVTQAGDYTTSVVLSSWENGVRSDTPPSTESFTITPEMIPPFTFAGKTDVYAGIEKFSLVFKQTAGSKCYLYEDQAAAQTAAESGDNACFVEFDNPYGFDITYSPDQFRLEGFFPSYSGGEGVGAYFVSRALADGGVETVQNGGLPDNAKPMPLPFATFVGGYKIPGNKYYVPMGQPIARAVINSPVTTTAKMKAWVQDDHQYVERAGIKAGRAYWLTTPGLGLLEERPVTVRVAWEDYPYDTSEQVVTAIGGTESNLKLVLDAPRKVGDTEDLNVKVRVGKYTKDGISYTPETMGQWRTQLFASTNTQSMKTPVTEMMDMVDGEANFQISAAGNLSMKLTAVSELVTTIDGLDITLASTTRYVEVVKGSPIEGTVVAKELDAPAPKTFTLNLATTPDNRAALKEAIWQESQDGGQSWADASNTNTIRHNLTLRQPAKRQVRVKMVNKNTLEESYTAPVEVWAYAVLDASIRGPQHMAPGSTATLTGELYQAGTLTQDTVNEWKVEAPSGTTTAAGATVTVSEGQTGKIKVTLRTRPADTRSNDPKAWTTTWHYLNVKPPARPNVNARGPRSVEIGKSYHYAGTVNPSWGSVASAQTIVSEWQMPDGTTVPGDSFDWTPTASDLSTIRPLVFRAWVDGFKDSTLSEKAVPYAPWEYLWPNFTIDMKQLSVQAPADLVLAVKHDQPAMGKRFEGLTYSWTFPAGITGRQNTSFPNRASAQAVYAGEYDVLVSIQDARGHKTDLVQHVVAEQAVPYSATLKVNKSNPYGRAPMTVGIRPSILGGHPLDKVVGQMWKVDGIPVDEYADHAFMAADIAEPGDHLISYTLTSKMGQTTTVESSLTLVANQPPVCQLVSKQNALAVSVEAKCTDADGKVRGYAWEVNGQPIGSTFYRISFAKGATPQSATVTVTATDDAKGVSTPVSVSVDY